MKQTDQELHLKLQTITNTMKLQQEGFQTVSGPDCQFKPCLQDFVCLYIRLQSRYENAEAERRSEDVHQLFHGSKLPFRVNSFPRLFLSIWLDQR